MNKNDQINSYYYDYKADLDAARVAESRNNITGARKLYRNAALALLKMAELESGETKKQHYMLAEQVKAMADNLGKTALSVTDDTGTDSGTGRKDGNGKPDNTGEKMWKTEGIPDTTFDDVVGMEDVKKLIRTRVIDQIKYPELYSQYGLKGGTGVLLFGLPGTGKTTIARAIAHEIGAPLYTVQLSDVLSKWVGETEKRISQLFETARSSPVSLIFFDDFDALGKMRQDEGSGHGNQVIVELINQMDGFRKNENTIVLLAATNRPWMIDSALMRPGRFEHHIYVPLADHDARIMLVKKVMGDVPVDPNLDLDRVSDLLKGYNGADIVSVVNSAKIAALQRAKAFIESGEDRLSEVSYDDLAAAADGHKSSVSPGDIAELRRYAKERDIELPEEL